LKTEIKIVDATDALPKHQTKRWSKRQFWNIEEVIIHQSVSTGGMFDVAKYHIIPTKDRDGNGIIDGWERNHISNTGCPGICYTLGVEKDGLIYKMNDFDDITWHAKGHNIKALGIVIFGNFSGTSWKGIEEPSMGQLSSLLKLLNYIRYDLLRDNNVPKERFFGHCEIDKKNKENCPGNIIMSELISWRGQV